MITYDHVWLRDVILAHKLLILTPMANGVSPLAAPALQISWGHSVIADGSIIYIFGAGVSSASPAVPVYLAKATSATITDYSQWSFLASNGTSWIAPPTTAAALKQIANTDVAVEFSVDKVTINGTARYVMVHGRPTTANDMVVQVSRSNSISDWETFNPSVTSQYHWEGAVYQSGAIDPQVAGPGEVVASCNGYTVPVNALSVYANKGMWALSPAVGTQAILYTSYYAPIIDFSSDSNDHRDYATCNEQAGFFAGALRFSDAIDLLKLRPWCTANCWN